MRYTKINNTVPYFSTDEADLFFIRLELLLYETSILR